MDRIIIGNIFFFGRLQQHTQLYLVKYRISHVYHEQKNLFLLLKLSDRIWQTRGLWCGILDQLLLIFNLLLLGLWLSYWM